MIDIWMGESENETMQIKKGRIFKGEGLDPSTPNPPLELYDKF